MAEFAASWSVRDERTGSGVRVAEITDDGVDVRRYESVDDLLADP